MSQTNSDTAFPATRWSMVAKLEGNSEEERRALEELCRVYRSPLYSFARHQGRGPSDAEDLVQEFLFKAATNGLFSKADEDRGKLRTFLLTAFRRFMRDEWEKARAQKRGGGDAMVSFDSEELESWYESEGAALDSPESVFDRRWAVSVLENTIERLGESWQEKGKFEEFELLRVYLTESGTAADYGKVGAKLEVKPEAVKVRIHRFRAKFASLLREEVADTIESDDDIDGELRYLIGLL